jgi:hypothetical protein
MPVLNKLLLTAENTDDLTDALRVAKSRMKVFPTASALIEAATRAEQELADAGVAKTNRPGCEYEYRGEGPWAKAYNNTKVVVAFRIRRNTRGWYIAAVGSATVYPRQNEISTVLLTAAARQAVIRKALSPFGTVSASSALQAA